MQANLYGMGRDPHLFEDALTYKPERWLRLENERKSEREADLQALSNLIWGHGARMCLGKTFTHTKTSCKISRIRVTMLCLGRRVAEQEIFMNLIKIVQNFRLTHCEDGEHVQPTLNTVMTPDRPVSIKFTPRTH